MRRLHSEDRVTRFGTFSMDILRNSVVSKFTAKKYILKKFLCCVFVEILNLKDSMRAMQNTYLFPVQIG
jgi:hypothetical protein